ncbi:hypothetical protein BLAT2472_60066 [Burkholderia latens]
MAPRYASRCCSDGLIAERRCAEPRASGELSPARRYPRDTPATDRRIPTARAWLDAVLRGVFRGRAEP